MSQFIKVLTATGPQYVRVSDIVSIQVDNNSATDWYVKITLISTYGSYAIIDQLTNANDAHALAREVAHALGLIDPEEYK